MDAASTLSAPERPADTAPPPAPDAAPAPRQPSMREVARRLVRYVRPHRWVVAAAVVLFFASSAIDPLVPALFKWLLDHGFKATPEFPVWPVPVVIVGLFAVRGALAFGGSYLFGRATADAVLA